MFAARAKKRFLGLSSKSSGTKEESSVTVSSAPVMKALTAEEHLLRQMALRYLVDQTLTVKEVASKLRITVRKLNTFFTENDFIDELKSRMDRVLGLDSEFRSNQAKISVVHLYEEIRRREAEDELKAVPLRDLHKMLTDMQKELRLDTPGEFTSKVGVADLSLLQDRYKKSLSGKLAKRKSLSTNFSKDGILKLKEGSSDSDDAGNENKIRGTG